MLPTSEHMFVQVVRAGSFKRAAEQLNLEPSSLSRKIAALEKRLNVKLLHRSTRRTRPTELGERYFEGLTRIIDQQAALEEGISSRVELLTGPFRVSAPVDFGVEFVVPVLRRMQREAPRLDIEVLLGSGFVDLLEQGIDVAIRIGELPDSNLIARKIGEVPRMLVASPDYLRIRGTPQTPDDLAEHDFVLYSSLQARSDIEFADGTRFPHAKVSSSTTVNSVRAIRQLVIDGAGLHLGPKWAFLDAVAEGKLEWVLPSKSLKSFPVHAVFVARDYLPRKTKLFVESLAEKVGALA